MKIDGCVLIVRTYNKIIRRKYSTKVILDLFKFNSNFKLDWECDEKNYFLDY